MAKGYYVPGWVRIGENEFKSAITKAMAAEPDLCGSLRRAIKATAGKGRVDPMTVNQYLGWIRDIEAALAALEEAEQSRDPGEAPQKLSPAMAERDTAT